MLRPQGDARNQPLGVGRLVARCGSTRGGALAQVPRQRQATPTTSGHAHLRLVTSILPHSCNSHAHPCPLPHAQVFLLPGDLARLQGFGIAFGSSSSALQRDLHPAVPYHPPKPQAPATPPWEGGSPTPIREHCDPRHVPCRIAAVSGSKPLPTTHPHPQTNASKDLGSP